MTDKTMFCFGFGFSAARLASLLRADGWTIAGTCRDADKATRLRQAGIEPHLFGPDRPLDPAVLSGFSHVVSSIPPDDDGDPVLRQHGVDLVRLAPGLAWVGYLSTTGVYGDRQGAWVDETAALMPSGPRGRRRVDAEAAWLGRHHEAGLPVHVFRLAGIYGPGRSALDTVRAGRAHRVVKPGQVFSRIHVDDIAAVLRASISRPRPGAVYNVCDDNPAPPDEVVAYACELLGVPAPPPVPFEEADLSPMARSFYDDNRRVDNGLIKRELGVQLAYPDYRSGLAAILSADT